MGLSQEIRVPCNIDFVKMYVVKIIMLDIFNLLFGILFV